MTPEKHQATCGVIYVATGDRFVREAEESLATLRAKNPQVPAMLLSGEDIPHRDLWDEVLVDPALKSQKNRAKLYMDRAPWERCLFLDTDTRVCADLSEGFALLDRFDFAGQHGYGGHHYKVPGVPASFPEVNSGVLFWRKSEQTKALFARWRELYDSLDQSHETRTWDQKSLRVALWESDVHFVDLPSIYNAMPYFPYVLERKLVIAHGRNMQNLEKFEAKVAETDKLRAYVPGLGAMEHPKDMSWGAVLRSVVRMLAWKVRGVIAKR
jgi:hypothetical protein